jgi:hypothetical protein
MGTVEVIIGAILTVVLAVLAEKYEGRVRVALWVAFVLLVIGLAIVQIVGKRRLEQAEVTKDSATKRWQQQISGKLDDLKSQVPSNERQQAAIELKRKLANPPGSNLLPLTLKGLFLTDFGANVNRSRLDNTTLTVGSKTDKFPEATMTFTPQLWIDLHEGIEILGFYIPIQDKDPDEASQRTVRLCKYLPDQFPALLKRLKGLQVSVPVSRGSMVKSTDLPLSRRIYIYHEDFISPQDLGDLVREYEARQLSVEFRGQDYLATQELLRALNQKR